MSGNFFSGRRASSRPSRFDEIWLMTEEYRPNASRRIAPTAAAPWAAWIRRANPRASSSTFFRPQSTPARFFRRAATPIVASMSSR